MASIFVGKACDLGASFRIHAGLVVDVQVDGRAMLATVFAHPPFALACPHATPRQTVCLPGIKVLRSPCAPHSVASLAGTWCVCVRVCVWVVSVSMVSQRLCVRALARSCVCVLVCMFVRILC